MKKTLIDIPAAEKGNFSIRHKAETIRLYEGDLWWTTFPETGMDDQKPIALKCFGKVLVGGLGLGVIVELLNKNTRVKSVVVVEIAQEVIDLVWPHLNGKSKAKIVCSGIKDYMKETKAKFDCVYLDIWPSKPERPASLLRLAEKLVAKENIFYWGENVLSR